MELVPPRAKNPFEPRVFENFQQAPQSFLYGSNSPLPPRMYLLVELEFRPGIYM